MKIIADEPFLIGPATISQVRTEFLELLKHAQGLKSILEIGSLYGGSASRLGQALAPGGRLVCVDLGFEPLKKGWVTLPTLLHRLSELQDRDVHLIIGSSQSAAVIEKVRALGPFDMVFIDGGHRYEEAKADWDNYSPMTNLVALHDIASNDGVRTLWRDIKHTHPKHAEYIHGPEAGTGVVWRSQ